MNLANGPRNCSKCKWWAAIPYNPRTTYRVCEHPALRAMGWENDDQIICAPDFGCVQFEGRDSA